MPPKRKASVAAAADLPTDAPAAGAPAAAPPAPASAARSQVQSVPSASSIELGESAHRGGYRVEYAASNRSTCKACQNTIEKDALRIGKMVPSSKFDGEIPLWHHQTCFLKRYGGEVSSIDQLHGIGKIRWEDQQALKAKLEDGGGGGGAKKRKADSAEAGPAKKEKTAEEVEYEKKLEAELKDLWALRDNLQKSVSNSGLREMLELNNQLSTGGELKLLERCAEGMLFGALPMCPDCKQGHLYYSAGVGYKCDGHASAWSKCQFVAPSVTTAPWKIPKDLRDEVDWLESWKFVPGRQMVPRKATVAPPPPPAPAASSAGSQDSQGASTGTGLLRGLVISSAGKMSRTQAKLEELISAAGGRYVKGDVEEGVTHVLTDQKTFDAKPPKIARALALGLGVVKEDWLTDSLAAGTLANEDNYLLGGKIIKSAQRDRSERKEKEGGTGDTGGAAGGKKTLKLKVKGRAAVDPDSGLEETCHVLEEGKDTIWNVVLNLSDAQRGTNSYYNLQLLEADASNKWYLFRKWGRVGTKIGDNKKEQFASKEGAKAAFEKLYEEKTGNAWRSRANSQKQPGKFMPVEVDYGTEEASGALAKSRPLSASCPLDPRLQDLISTLFDIQMMKNTLLEMEIDLQKMPLGKLTKRHIEQGFAALNDLSQVLSAAEPSKNAILDCTNRFYTLIPHDFGMKKPPLLDSMGMLKDKVTMLEALRDIEIATEMLKEDSDSSDTLSAHYKKLNTALVPLEHSSDEFRLVHDYLKNTHGLTHNNYTLDLEQVFKVDRSGELDRFQKFKDLHNRQLLWHGSRLTNFVGILSQGLRIAPPEAPVTGYMFGKGVYFADVVSKSANYCFTTPANPRGVMLLSDVALGNMNELLHAQYMDKPPKGTHSTKGCGKNIPDPKEVRVVDDGKLTVPLGHCIDATKTDARLAKSSLLYNEFIVYDVAQIKIRYLLRVKFNYK